MRKYSIIYIVLAVIAIFGALGFLLFEVKEIPDLKWTQRVDYDSKEAYGTWLLKSMLEEKYGTENVIDLAVDYQFDSTDTNALYLFTGNSHLFEQNKYELIDSFLLQGNEALIISDQLDFPRDTFSKSPYFYLDANFDSIHILSVCDDTLNQFLFHSYKDDLATLGMESCSYLDPYVNDSNYVFRPILCTGDSIQLFIEDKNYDYPLYYHFYPKAFVNVSAIDDSFLDHFNFVFSQFSVDKIYLDKPRNHGYIGQDENSSPLKYLLNEPPLAYAYYLTIAAALLFIIFGSKRKQRIIPVIPRNENSSLEYVEMLSQLFMAQNQNQKLVIHIKDNFNHKIAKKYFLKPGSPELTKNLAKKSGIPIDRIKNIFYFFNKAEDKRAISDEELNKLYNQLEYFNQNAI